MTKEQFEKSCIASIRSVLRDSRVTENSRLERVILDVNRRVTINNKSVWNSKKLAENAIKKYIREGGRRVLAHDSVWRRAAGDWNAKPESWAKK